MQVIRRRAADGVNWETVDLETGITTQTLLAVSKPLDFTKKNDEIIFEGKTYVLKDENNSLKPCPFCGGDAKERFSDSYGQNWTIECMKCACDIGWFDTLNDAIISWNKRFEKAYKVKEYDTSDDSTLCYGCGNCSYGWHISKYDKPFSYCPNCRVKLEY